MTRSLGRRLLPALLLLLAASQVSADDNCYYKQWMGCGYGPGYNAPSKHASCGMVNNWGRGCCEVPSNWRLHVWDGYHGDPADYQRSLIGAQTDYNRRPLFNVYSTPGAGTGPGPGMNAGAACADCQRGVGAGPYSSAMPVANPTPVAEPTPVEVQPDVQSGRANSSIRESR